MCMTQRIIGLTFKDSKILYALLKSPRHYRRVNQTDLLFTKFTLLWYITNVVFSVKLVFSVQRFLNVQKSQGGHKKFCNSVAVKDNYMPLGIFMCYKYAINVRSFT